MLPISLSFVLVHWFITVSSIATLGCYVVTYHSLSAVFRSRQSEGKRRGCAYISDVSAQCHGTQVSTRARVVNSCPSHNCPPSPGHLRGLRVFKSMSSMREPASDIPVESLHAHDPSFMFVFTVLGTPVIAIRFCFLALGKSVSHRTMYMA